MLLKFRYTYLLVLFECFTLLKVTFYRGISMVGVNGILQYVAFR